MKPLQGGAFAALWICLIWATTAAAQVIPDTLLRELGLPYARTGSADRIQSLQVDLSWIGLYKGQITGTRTPELSQAIRLFQKGLGAPSKETLTTAQRQILSRRAAATRKGAEFVTQTQEWTGTRFSMPRGFLAQPDVWGEHREQLTYRGQDVSRLRVNIESYAFANSTSDWKKIIEGRYKENKMQLFASSAKGGFLGLVAYDPATKRREYTIVSTLSNRSILLVISLQEASVSSMRPLIGEIISSFRPFHGTPLSRTEIRRRMSNGDLPGRDNTGWLRTAVGNGSGSIVSVNGHVLTNHHVVEDCDRVTVFGRPATLLGSDVRTDLALVIAPDLAGRDPVRFRKRLAPLGSDVYVMGYPKFSITQSLNITQGIVSSTVGLFGDKRHMQITAAVQGGNSGGPVLAADGTQVGVVVSKPAAELIATEGLENIAWIIRSNVAQDFLRRFGVRTVKQSASARPLARE